MAPHSSKVSDGLFYSRSFRALNDHLQQHRDLQARKVNFDQSGVVSFMRQYEYQVADWPVVIDQKLIDSFDDFLKQLPHLMFSAIGHYFQKDSVAFADYLNVPAFILDLVNEAKLDFKELIFRHDLVFTDDCFKLLEVNAGTTIGGWQHDWVASLYSQQLDNEPLTKQMQLKYRDVMAGMLAAVGRGIARQGKADAVGNILCASYFESVNGREYESLEQALQSVYERCKPASLPQGKLLFCKDFSQVRFDGDNLGGITFNGEPIDAVMLPLPPGMDIPRPIYLKFVATALKNHIVFPDSPLHTLIGNKHLLTLLHEPMLRSIFTPEQLLLIENHVPWSSRLGDKPVVYQGEAMPMRQLLTDHQLHLVLKKAQSAQGTDVYIGCNMTTDEWQALSERVITEPEWMVQQYCAPDSVMACRPGAGVVPHQMVWGVFDFENQYCGAFVRGMTLEKNSGVINSANGALEFIVFEQPELDDASESLNHVLHMCEKYHVELALNDGALDVMFDDDVPDELFELLKANKPALMKLLAEQAVDDDSIIAIERDNQPLPLSFAQQRLWLVDKLQQGSANFNMTSAIDVAGPLDLWLAERAFIELIRRHEPLRTGFVEIDGEPKQQPQARFDFQLAVVESTAGEFADEVKRQLIAEQNNAFDLAEGLMLRASFIRRDSHFGTLVLSVHHIAADGWSLGILVNEFVHLYQALSQGVAPELKPLSVQYADYALWQRRHLSQDKFKAQLAHWLETLKDAPTIHSLVTDFPRGESDGQAQVVSLDIPSQLHLAVAAVAKDKGLTTFMLLHGALALLLSRHSASSDMVIGTPTANRTRVELEPLVGFFVNTLVLRNSTDFDLIDDYLTALRSVHLDAQQHQDVLLEQIVDGLGIEQTLEHGRLVQILFSMDTSAKGEMVIPGLKLTPQPRAEVAGSKFDLEIAVRKAHSEQDEGLVVDWIYDRSLFCHQRVERIARQFNQLLQAIVSNPNGRIASLDMFGAELPPLSGSNKDFSGLSSTPVHQLFFDVAAQMPDAHAIETSGGNISYGQLAVKVTAMSQALSLAGVKPGDYVALCFNDVSLIPQAFMAVLSAGGAAVLLDPNYPKERLSYMLSDSTAVMALCDESGQQALNHHDIKSHKVDELIDSAASVDFAQVEIVPDSPAYLIYTSGSTGLPKGVCISQQNWYAYYLSAKTLYGIEGPARLLQMSSTAFDIFIEELSLTLLLGGTLVVKDDSLLPSGEDFWQLLAQHDIDSVSLPTAYWHQLCSAASLTEQLHNTPLKRLILGGEAMAPAALNQWFDALGDKAITLFNTYGPTETTVICSAFEVANRDYRYGGVPIGRAVEFTELLLLDSKQQPVPQGAIGELYIGGPNVALGYHNNPKADAEAFVQMGAQGRYYRSGDLARVDEQGLLRFCGRNDAQVKISGYRIEPAEVEQAIGRLNGVHQAAVIVDNHQGHKRLLAFVCSERDEAELLNELAQQLPRHMLPAQLLVIEAMPLTANGKVDSKQLAAMLTSEAIKPHAQTEAASANEWVVLGLAAKVLGLPLERLSLTDDFFKSGGNSLLALKLLAEIEAKFNRKIPLKRFFAQPSLAMLASLVKDATINEGSHNAIAVMPKEQDIVTSAQQNRIWLLDKLNQDDGGAYHIYSTYKLAGALNTQALSDAIMAVVADHQVLRTVYVEQGRQVLQHVLAEPQGIVAQIDLSDLTATEQQAKTDELLRQAATGRFDLARDCPIRVVLIQLSDELHLLHVCLHHIAADGWSVSILAKGISHYYQAAVGPAAGDIAPVRLMPQVQYRDYSQWQAKQLSPSEPECAAMLKFWQQRLADAPLCHDLALDFPRPLHQQFVGEVYRQELDSELAVMLRQCAVQHNVSLFMLLQTLFALLLGRYSNSQDILMGTPVANRSNTQLEDVIGCFINTIVLRTELTEGVSFSQLLAQNASDILDAFGHQSLPFETLVERLKVERHTAFGPLFQIFFVLHNNAPSELNLGQVDVDYVELPNQTAKFDLTLNIFDDGERLVIEWEFNKALFAQARIAELAHSYAQLSARVLADTEQPIDKVPLLSAQEAKAALALPPIEAPRQSVHQLIAQKVATCPDATAIIDGDKHLSYAELERQSNRLARRLMTKGVGKGTAVAVLLEHDWTLPLSLLAVMKTGACYVPMDIDAPAARKQEIVEQAKAVVAISHSVQPLTIEVIAPQADDSFDDSRLGEQLGAEQLAYVLFTSGSTGKPKGVEISHGAFVNLLLSMAKKPGFSASDKLLALTASTFDISGLELFLPLVCGGTLVLGARAFIGDGERLAHMIEREQVTVMQATPTLWRVLIDAQWSGKADLKALCGGEALTLDLAHSLAAKVGSLWNMYGPTETTIWSFCQQISADCELVSIGEPIDNTAYCILDSACNPLPPGAAGQLFIGGSGLAQGYLNRPELTEKVFVEIDGKRWYATGDLVRRSAQGLVFLGRIDHQIKLHGFRIEPGEIEACLNAQPSVSDSLVVLHRDTQNQRDALVAYVVASEAGVEPDVAQLRGALSDAVPAYMVPSIIMPIDAFSLTTSGKKDRKALPEPKAVRAVVQAFVAPDGELEQFIAEHLTGRLGLERIGSNDNFFEVGATSLDLVSLADALSTKLNRKISAVELFDKSNITALASWLGQSGAEQAPPRVERTEQRAKGKSRLQARIKRNAKR